MFRRSLVLTYAVPASFLRPHLPCGLDLDEMDGLGFLAIAMVQTRSLRPVGLPAALGRDFFLAGYRIFARWRHPDGRVLRGLRILRSDTDARLMVLFGNLLTHYRYQMASVKLVEEPGGFHVNVRTKDGLGDLDLVAQLASDAVGLPEGSPFRDLRHARLYAGPMPFTFDHEPETDSIIVIEGVREAWRPRPIEVEVRRVGFLDQPMFKNAGAKLANAFVVENVPYLWKRGMRYRIPQTDIPAKKERD